MKCLLVSNWGENNFNILHSAGGVLHNNAYSHYCVEVAKLLFFFKLAKCKIVECGKY